MPAYLLPFGNFVGHDEVANVGAPFRQKSFREKELRNAGSDGARQSSLGNQDPGRAREPDEGHDRTLLRRLAARLGRKCNTWTDW